MPCPEGSFLAPEIGRLFGDVVGASLVAVAAAHDWKLDDTKGYQTCLIKASIDSRVFKYPDHSDTLPHINPIGKIRQELACNWNTDDAPLILPFLCVL